MGLGLVIDGSNEKLYVGGMRFMRFELKINLINLIVFGFSCELVECRWSRRGA